MSQREFLDVDPKRLRLPPSRRFGPDLTKFQRQVAIYGADSVGMPPLEVSRGNDGLLMINDGVTRATRIAKLAPGKTVRVEVIDNLPFPAGRFPAVEDVIP